MSKMKLVLRDARGVVVDTMMVTHAQAAFEASKFVVLHGTDPDEDGKGAQAGSIQFEPVKANEGNSVTVSLIPNLSPEKAAEVNSVLDLKNHAEYLGVMALKALDRRFNLRLVLEKAVKAGIIDQDMYEEAYGDPEEGGFADAGSKTVPEIIKEWEDITNRLHGLMSGR